MHSKRTGNCRKLFLLFSTLSFCLNIAPLGYYIIKALIEADLTHEKVALTSMVFIVLILSIVSWVNKITLRSKLWIILIGLYICLDYIMTPLIIIAICQVIDELIISPLAKNYKTKLTINKEMDKRA